MDTYSKSDQPTQATDETGQNCGEFGSPFLAAARAEQETAWDTTNGQWTYTPAN
ncbi:hypothetical protein [Streptomyces sp. NPDC056154]|uniref:hypothetical protein n=1 Tax=unclassified Streptomyces TaxID=2593676 RepID=UPI0035E099C5